MRSGGEVFVFDGCRDDEPFFISAYNCKEGLKDMIITELPNNRYEVCDTRNIMGRIFSVLNSDGMNG